MTLAEAIAAVRALDAVPDTAARRDRAEQLRRWFTLYTITSADPERTARSVVAMLA